MWNKKISSLVDPYATEDRKSFFASARGAPGAVSVTLNVVLDLFHSGIAYKYLSLCYPPVREKAIPTSVCWSNSMVVDA